MSKDTLDNLFGSKVRVKILKFLFRNYPASIDIQTLAQRTQESPRVVRQEVEVLRSIKLLKKK